MTQNKIASLTDDAQPKETKKQKGGAVKTIKAIKLLSLATVISSLVLAVYWFNQWSQYNKIVFQTPVLFQTPVYIERVEFQVISPIAGAKEKPQHEALTKEEVIKQADNAEILHKINILETTRGQAPTGLHKYCNDRDMSNEFGFDPFNKTCFDSFAESVATVDQWFNDRFAEGFTLNEALCYYNTGYKVGVCDYVNNYNSL